MVLDIFLYGIVPTKALSMVTETVKQIRFVGILPALPGLVPAVAAHSVAIETRGCSETNGHQVEHQVELTCKKETGAADGPSQNV